MAEPAIEGKASQAAIKFGGLPNNPVATVGLPTRLIASGCPYF
jgi:hypothetical protein